MTTSWLHDDVIKWKHFPRYWPFMRETTGHRWIPLTKASDAELSFFFALRLDTRWANNWDTGELRLRSLWRHCNDLPHTWLAMGGFVCSRPGFCSQRPVTRNVEVFFDWHLKKRSSKQSRRRMMTSQITGVSIVCSGVGSGAEKTNRQSSGPPCEGNPPVTDGFP